MNNVYHKGISAVKLSIKDLTCCLIITSVLVFRAHNKCRLQNTLSLPVNIEKLQATVEVV